MNLFNKGAITLASGQQSDFKIDCDALTDEDIECLAYLISQRVKFRLVFGIPKGGLRLEQALTKYRDFGNPDLPILVVDDVYTTGGTLRKYFGGEPPEGPDHKPIVFVIFARTKPPDWVNVLFQM